MYRLGGQQHEGRRRAPRTRLDCCDRKVTSLRKQERTREAPQTGVPVVTATPRCRVKYEY